MSELTSQVYNLMVQGEYGEVIRQMSSYLHSFPRSRAALSLLGYAHYALADFRNAAQCYEELCRYYPEVESYRLYYSQCLGKAGLHAESMRSAALVTSEAYVGRVLMLQASVAYAEGDLATTRTLLEQFPGGDRDAKVNRACVLYKEGKFEEARKRFEEALLASGWAPDLAYNVAVCHYAEKSYGPALRCISELIERGVQEHPELSVGSGSAASGEVRSVGNTPALRETALVEAFNLKVAIELVERNYRGARESLGDMPPRREDELDPVTLHNSALVEVEMEANPVGAFRKLNFLLSHPPFPAEAFGNLLLLYLRMDASDHAADVMAENSHLVPKFLSPGLGEFLDAYCMSGHSAEEAYDRLDALASRHTVALRAHTKSIQDARLAHDGEGVKAGLGAFDDVLEAFMPVVLGMCRLFWAHDNFVGVEKELRKASEFAGEHEAWRIGMAHAVFMQGTVSSGNGGGGRWGHGGCGGGGHGWHGQVQGGHPPLRTFRVTFPGGGGGGGEFLLCFHGHPFRQGYCAGKPVRGLHCDGGQ